MKRQVLISRSSVMRLVEAISITIAQHTGSAVETLWASEGDQSKLDVYYREAISDLERSLAGYIDITSSQFNLQDDASDYTLSLKLSDMWATRMYGVLCNKVQDYIVHSITAGWLNDFAGLEIKQDYREMAVQDVADILYLVARKEFGFAETGRNEIVEDKVSDTIFGSVAERSDSKDTAKVDGGFIVSVFSRNGANDIEKMNSDDGMTLTVERNVDNARVSQHRCFVDWGDSCRHHRHFHHHHFHHHRHWHKEEHTCDNCTCVKKSEEQVVLSCFSKGYWVNGEMWTNALAWANN